MVPGDAVDGDERHAALDQSPGEQGALAEGVPAVGVAEGVGFGEMSNASRTCGWSAGRRRLLVLVQVAHAAFGAGPHADRVARSVRRSSRRSSVRSPASDRLRTAKSARSGRS